LTAVNSCAIQHLELLSPVNISEHSPSLCHCWQWSGY